MNEFLVMAFLFFIGSMMGWGIEVVFRRFFSSSNKERRWINPGFLMGPYLPLYGCSLCVLFMVSQINLGFVNSYIFQKLILFASMSITVTGIEFIAGIIFIRYMKIKLWDYTNEWGNIKGIICPRFSAFWAILSAIYYFIIHPHILDSLYWLSNHLAFSFVMGFFYGVFTIDFCYSMNIMVRVRKFAHDNEIVVKYELLKSNIRNKTEERLGKKKFIFTMNLGRDAFAQHLKNYFEQEHLKFKTDHKISIAKKLKKSKYKNES